jgi:hypothetical protein
MAGLIGEFKRRNVFRAGAADRIVAGFRARVTDALFDLGAAHLEEAGFSWPPPAPVEFPARDG